MPLRPKTNILFLFWISLSVLGNCWRWCLAVDLKTTDPWKIRLKIASTNPWLLTGRRPGEDMKTVWPLRQCDGEPSQVKRNIKAPTCARPIKAKRQIVWNVITSRLRFTILNRQNVCFTCEINKMYRLFLCSSPLFFLSALFQLRGHGHSGCWATLTQEALSHMETSKNEHSAVGYTMLQSVPLCLLLFFSSRF